MEALSALVIVNSFFKDYPYISSFIVTGLKGCVADGIAQVSERDDTSKRKAFCWLRNLAFLLYAGCYQGCMQHFIYNKMFPIMFGAGSDLQTVFLKVFFELFIQTPLVCLPLAYLIKAIIFKGLALKCLQQGLSAYINDVVNHGILQKYWMLWGPVQCLTFSVVPEHLRISFIAAVSFFWTIILSSIVNRNVDRNSKKQGEEAKQEVQAPVVSSEGPLFSELETITRQTGKSFGVSSKALLLSEMDNNEALVSAPSGTRSKEQLRVLKHSKAAQPSHPGQTVEKSEAHGKNFPPSEVHPAQPSGKSSILKRIQKQVLTYPAQLADKSGLFGRHRKGGHYHVQFLEIPSTRDRHAEDRMTKVFANNRTSGLSSLTSQFLDMAPHVARETVKNISSYRHLPNLLLSM
eukprot:gnl/MRDRNA2_/MRDRNA2_127633_c0_seq1.p1 gnl/MRDRNA2_/MRDRNA2_127633_c0~~gnl/MRDRNA2_/MRDRNA2_127633_c0_seq1.p1  ORF type:complete len:435 (-),score=54.31 gnl/MRDRNA2_/MRDRNA2_127633_c0_seq1:5-1219(-)